MSCNKSSQHDLAISDSETKTRLIAELTKKKINYQLASNNSISFSQNDKKEVYNVLNQILATKPKEPISVSCELEEQKVTPAPTPKHQ